MNHKLVKTSNFLRTAKKHYQKNPDFAVELNETLKLLSENVFDAKLKTHKLKGELNDCWACSINFKLRIVFQFVKAIDNETGENVDAISLLTIGSHDNVY
ncbi:MAG: type II toxin-antitoxin system mRNA interferase toxin, RelE/StbE family [bacterium]